MIKVIVGSTNPVKVNAAKQAITNIYPNNQIECLGINAPSLVPDQPMNSQETKQGALNRIDYCQKQSKADFYLAIEGGVDLFEHGPATFAYIAITDGTHTSIGRSSMLPLPPKIFQALQLGEELGLAMDRLFNTHNIKQKQGAIGLLTNGLATRESIYTQACILAMAPFINPDLFNCK
ncbi:inosine/xanthosine triphosphatase [Paraglaciecola aquimarina]|uniref:Inosine/xanthosine triphosphatase n=1 Tax=Paraglaciecola algarum TaxID=3050085 RepID=A0ABS9D3G6_9ALTE|nr:inosine/xanthosine triphosphatase [Paraglaciecola sp. G1-23]MCF2947476.1 inosine/xanthosine triphosphatase [Paraglaciecola sp. G1-23]